MIHADAIPDLVHLLSARGVSLWHACQFRDFQSYLAVGGIPSRACLEGSGSGFTAYETDSSDHSNAVWDKVFVNLTDFGHWFAKGAKNVPNPYGPIVLKINPKALCEATDVAVCLRSAGGWRFERSKEALKSVQDIDFLFEHPVETGFPLSSYVKFQHKLREKYPSADEPEVSCTIPTGRLSIRHVEMACVDPYSFPDKRLLHYVDEVRAPYKGSFRIHERRCKDASRPALYDELAKLIVNGVPALKDVGQNEAWSENLKTWCQNIMKLEWQFKRFATYLRDGTLLPILKPDTRADPANPPTTVGCRMDGEKGTS